MEAILEIECPRCGRAQDARTLSCNLCGNLLRHESKPATGVGVAPESAVKTGVLRAPVVERESHLEPWTYLAIGVVTAPIFAATPILKFMGWFLSALVHEMGHAALGWFCGMPAIPAISLAGHAAAVHAEQQPVLVALIAVGIGTAAWRIFEGRVRWIVLGLAAGLYPAIALTSARDLLHLLAGHGSELLFATLCLWKALDGGFTESRFERALYGTVGWYLLGKNTILCFGLMHSAPARAEYDQSGSFGLTNDYLRAAQEVLSWRLESVAMLMFAACLLVLPVSIGLWRFTLALRRG